ncbi:MAG: class II aldolase [Rhodospirillales bacterium]|nr:class II aldolase [Rhodospirillales bacterium]
MTETDLRQSAEFAALRLASARIGQDPMQIQGPGGNVSFKNGAHMLIKASGTWLADSATNDVFTAVNAAAMKDAVIASAPTADTPQLFQNSDGLRPSIEAGFHAVLDAPVVIHTHCVATLARATVPITRSELDPLGLVWVDYVKPGAALARAIRAAWRPGAQGAVLGNHGIIAVGQTTAEAEAVLARARNAFDPGAAPSRAADPSLVTDLAGTPWKPLGAGATTAIAFDPVRLGLALGSAFFPDQVIFLGPSPFIAESGPIVRPDGQTGALAFYPDKGAAIPQDASPAQEALAQMIGEVVYRLPSEPKRLDDSEIAELLGWDAEKYRQSLQKARTARLQDGARS